MKASDAQMQRDVLAELRADPTVSPGTIGVAVFDGVVSLAGQVDSLAEKRAAIRAAERVPGVQAVLSSVMVRIPGALTDGDNRPELSSLLMSPGPVVVS